MPNGRAKSGDEPFDCLLEILNRPGFELDGGDAGGGSGDEHEKHTFPDALLDSFFRASRQVVHIIVTFCFYLSSG